MKCIAEKVNQSINPSISLRQLNRDDPIDAMALNVFARALHFAPGEAIPHSLLVFLPDENDSWEDMLLVEDGLSRLVSLGFLTPTGDRTYVIHPVYGDAWSLKDNARRIINPGSVGQPRDSDPRAAYGLLDLEKMTWEHCRVEYDIERTQKRMRDEGLSDRLIARLSFGW